MQVKTTIGDDVNSIQYFFFLFKFNIFQCFSLYSINKKLPSLIFHLCLNFILVHRKKRNFILRIFVSVYRLFLMNIYPSLAN